MGRRGGRRGSLVTTVLGTVALVGLIGCGPQAGTPSDRGQATTVPDHAPESTRLTVTVGTGGSAQRTYTLGCDPPGGDHPDPEAACAALAAARRPFAPVPKDLQCTQIYGGPQTATIAGTWRGEQVSASFDRTDGCEIARWDALAPVLGTTPRRLGRPGST